MKSLALATLTVLTALTATAPALAEGKDLYRPYPQDVNRYNNALKHKERLGGFNYWNNTTYIINRSNSKEEVYRINNPCKDFVVGAKVEGRVLVTIITPCLADKVTAIFPGGQPTDWHTTGEGFGYELMRVFKESNNNPEDRYFINFKVRTSAGKLIGESATNGEFFPAIGPHPKVHVSKDKFVRVR